MRYSAVCLFLILVISGSAYAESIWTVINKPGTESTGIYGISGSKVVGYYADFGTHRRHGVIYDTANQSWSTLDAPGDVSPWGTQLYGISGNIVAGYSLSSSGYTGQTYNLTMQAWTNITCQNSSRVQIYGIDGSNLVGNYFTNKNSGFLYDGTTWRSLDMPGTTVTNARGISGNNIVGYGWNTSGIAHGFLYNITNQSWTNLNVPGADQTYVYGINGNNIVGGCFVAGSSLGFIYNMETQLWTTLNMPGAIETTMTGIEGNNIIGTYGDGSGNTYSFIYTIPEPATILLLTLGGLLLRKYKK